MRIIKQIYLGLLVLVSVQGTLLEAKLIEFPLDEMVKRSDLIIIGEVIKLEKTDESFRMFDNSPEIYWYTAKIRVEKALKGSPETKELLIHYYLHPEEPQFKLERAIMFITRFKGKLVI